MTARCMRLLRERPYAPHTCLTVHAALPRCTGAPGTDTTRQPEHAEKGA
jgi:hypothetical protein